MLPKDRGAYYILSGLNTLKKHKKAKFCMVKVHFGDYWVGAKAPQPPASAVPGATSL